MTACRLLWIVLFSNVIWITVQKEIIISRNQADLSLSCENTGDERIIYVTGVNGRSTRRNDLIQLLYVGCEDRQQCSISVYVPPGQKVQIKYQCRIGTSQRATFTVTTDIDEMGKADLKCGTGSIRINDAFSSPSPSTLQLLDPNISKSCNEKHRCDLTPATQIVPEGTQFAISYECMKKIESCRITVTEDFMGQTLISASEMIIESENFRQGSYIKPPEIKCRITSATYKYLTMSVFEFDSENPTANFSLKFVSKHEKVSLQAEQDFIYKNKSIHLIYLTGIWHEDISMVWQASTRKNVRFYLEMKAFDDKNQTSIINITCRQQGSYTVPNIKTCPSHITSTAAPATLTTTQTLAMTNTTKKVHTTPENDDHLTNIPSSSNIYFTNTKYQTKTGNPTQPPYVTSSPVHKPENTTSNSENTPTNLPTKRFTNQDTSTILPNTTPLPKYDTDKSSTGRYTTSLPNNPEYITPTVSHTAETPQKHTKDNSVTEELDRNQQTHAMVTVINASTVTTDVTAIKTRDDIIKKITDIGWKVAVIGIFLLITTAIITKLYLKRRRSKTYGVKKRGNGLAISELSFGALPYAPWDSGYPANDNDNTEGNLTTTFQEDHPTESMLAGSHIGLIPNYADPSTLGIEGRRPSGAACYNLAGVQGNETNHNMTVTTDQYRNVSGLQHNHANGRGAYANASYRGSNYIAGKSRTPNQGNGQCMYGNVPGWQDDGKVTLNAKRLLARGPNAYDNVPITSNDGPQGQYKNIHQAGAKKHHQNKSVNYMNATDPSHNKVHKYDNVYHGPNIRNGHPPKDRNEHFYHEIEPIYVDKTANLETSYEMVVLENDIYQNCEINSK